MSESTFSYKGYELTIDLLECDTVVAKCDSACYYRRLDSAGEAVDKFIEFVNTELSRRLELRKILQYQQEVWEKQDNLEGLLNILGGYSFYTYTIPGAKDSSYRVAVHEDYKEAFQKDKNRDFPKWAVVRIF